MQGYLFKLPKFFVNLFPSLLGEVRTEKLIDTPVAATTSAQLGSTYRLADEQGSVGERDPFSVDPLWWSGASVDTLQLKTLWLITLRQ